ncbi:heme biosynthesis HemY N-terminal domain-containing protein [Marinimicrobium sp. ABcell2]|uniref:heme biosynthesis HemY N-terminal domain-containing protein n=1 Tax=Marinimicrobium sp. ABcell2 TaxID=3069751 RepID=UPI0027B2BA14|nr:heme biosynthesis HemY N-terminal domain-containing protein [Marinimicrobium sp. ABcell2]MDQ2076939.1 heme biosynthesis HemY N-terminal domain-containing protein [Marinimicrobium sp. ABcell2]
MKRTLLLVLAAMLLGGLTLAAVRADSGYILIALGNTSVEMSFWFGVLLLVIALALLLLVVRLVRGTMNISRRLSQGMMSSARAQRRTTSGLIDFIEGNWKQAQRKLLRAAKRTETPLINYLAAARCAYEAGDRKTALELLHKAEQSSPNSDLAVALTQARMQLVSKRYEQCLATLERVRRKAPQHPVILDLLRQVYVALEDWDSLQEILPSLRAYGSESPVELDRLTFQLHLALLRRSGHKARQKTSDEALKLLHKTWDHVPNNLKREPEIVLCYAQQLIDNQLHEEAEALVRKTLEKHWDRDLVRLYGLIAGPDSRKQLVAAESWLKKRPGDALLLLSLGRLSLRNELWGRAKDYFQTSLGLQPLPETCAELARLLAHLGEHQKSTEFYQKGLLMTTHNLPALPQPKGKPTASASAS